MNGRRKTKNGERRAKSTRVYVFCALLYALSSLPFAFSLEAKVTGNCNYCHTMHNSQNGQPMAKSYASGGLVDNPRPNEALLLNDCIGCHFNLGTTTIDSHGTPIVLNTSAPGSPLAGGNFYHVADGLGGTYNTGHNVKGISAQENSPMDIPPGFLSGVTLPNGGTGPGSWSQQLTCAGTYGCHGNRTITDEIRAVFGGHHGNINTNSSSPADAVYNSYRFLFGIKGAEDNDWEQTVGTNDHNGYQGDSLYGIDNTISYLCGECHGNFHANTNLGGTGNVGDSTPWLRHPTDFAFSGVRDGSYAGSEYSQYNTPNTNIYNIVAPVAETNPTTNNSTVSSGSIVMCLSCHRAHASPFYFKMMRWDYKSSTLSEALSGCNICHTSKN
jgi:hypothetical protein